MIGDIGYEAPLHYPSDEIAEIVVDEHPNALLPRLRELLAISNGEEEPVPEGLAIRDLNVEEKRYVDRINEATVRVLTGYGVNATDINPSSRTVKRYGIENPGYYMDASFSVLPLNGEYTSPCLVDPYSGVIFVPHQTESGDNFRFTYPHELTHRYQKLFPWAGQEEKFLYITGSQVNCSGYSALNWWNEAVTIIVGNEIRALADASILEPMEDPDYVTIAGRQLNRKEIGNLYDESVRYFDLLNKSIFDSLINGRISECFLDSLNKWFENSNVEVDLMKRDSEELKTQILELLIRATFNETAKVGALTLIGEVVRDKANSSGTLNGIDWLIDDSIDLGVPGVTLNEEILQ
ncbi:hypothetical protein GF389_05285 [Candidatus Dojkabacteria bacterium]|nr:hypothetical protein [Candidatus Dojkabacteria bacterium]